MNFFRNKMILYMLIIATGVDIIVPWPIFLHKVPSNVHSVQPSGKHKTSFSLPVAQPTWLNIGRQDPPIDPKVYVNGQALQDAVEIRRVIQKAVDEDRYAVTGEQQDLNTDNLPTFAPPEEAAPQPMQPLANWYQNMQKLFQNLFTGLRN